MKCPTCGRELFRQEYHDLDLDTCQECGGIWLDGSNIGKYIKLLLEDNQDIPAAKLDLDREIKAADNLTESDKACPRCAKRMEKFNYAYDSNVILDKCPACNAIWIEPNELRQLATYLKDNPRLEALAGSFAKLGEEREARREKAALANDASTGVPLIFRFLPLRIILPLGDDQSAKTIPLVTCIIILANVAVFLYQWFFVDDLISFFREYGIVSSEVMPGENHFHFLSSMFLHVGWLHLVVNIYFLWIFGDNVEDVLGHLVFPCFYLIVGFSASLFHVFADPVSDIPAVGASGAIAGVMGAYFLLYPRAKIRVFVIMRVVDVPAFLFLGIWIGFQILYAVIYSSQHIQPAIGWFAHIGGFFAGLGLMWFYRLLRPERQGT